MTDRDTVEPLADRHTQRPSVEGYPNRVGPTPGPWRVKLVPAFNEGMPMASVWVEAGEYTSVANLIPHKGVEANANLIAAAPDLLAALKRVMAVCDIPEAQRVPAMNAISKAEGQSA